MIARLIRRLLPKPAPRSTAACDQLESALRDAGYERRS